MSKNLVIVESPAKCKTIKKYLGKGYEVMASYGHVRDLIPKEGAVDTEHDFDMKYQMIERNSKHVDAIVKAMKKSDALYLATDPDREGEAISWHLCELLKNRKVLKDKTVHRVVFNEITKRAVNDAIENPRELSTELINAQQARRALDYLVGFNLSPLLWKKIRRGLSAGRVQTPALRMIVEREIEIEKFEPREYWTLESDLSRDDKDFIARLTQLHGEKLKQFSITDDSSANKAREELLAAADGKLVVEKVEKKQRKRNPTAPFTTSTLQQEASRKLGFTASRTMRVAQQLYEGMEIGGDTAGLITYMRTDSVTLSQDALDELRAFIPERYGKGALPAEVRTYKTKAKNAQEAHEAIRPTTIGNTPDEIKKYLSAEQFKLYDLIWKRTVSCQMIHATINTVSVDFKCGEGNLFRANGSTIVDPGFMAVYQEGEDDKKGSGDETMLPPLEKGDSCTLKTIRADQHFTEPPPRYSEASLVKSLEEHGIGRPSSYATIISTLQAREYVTLEKKRFDPTDVGRVVIEFLTDNFTSYVDYDFTAGLEDELDAVARGEKEWIPLMNEFWKPFNELLGKDYSRPYPKPMEEKCPDCGKPLQMSLGRGGFFIGCSGYPDCKYTRNVDESRESAAPEVVEGRSCPKCESDLIIRSGRYGKFIGCSSYPACKYIEPLEKPEDTGVQCPECKKGSILKRKSRRGKVFFSCERYPDCKYAIWNQPLAQPCPKCHWPITSIKTTKRSGTQRVCPQQDCKFVEPWDEPIPAAENTGE
ncbi:MAG: type I DNA topoisomerase [Gammaproteobacteria bacterium]|nr:MAG: type I DNA topoisomerase [Gammaproteobacteria bacterium]